MQMVELSLQKQMVLNGMLKVLYPESRSSRKGAFSIKNVMKKINRELKKGHNVIIDVTDLIPEHIIELKNKLLEEGILDRIMWYPPYLN